MASKNRNLISSEALCGGMFSLNCCETRHRILKDLKKIFKDFDIKIILGIREQISLILSFYKQYLQEGGAKSLTGFLCTIMGDGFKNDFNTEHPFFKRFEYGEYIEDIAATFGKDNVYVYLFENLKKDKRTFLKNLLNFLGEKKIPVFEDKVHNKGYGATQVRIARGLNRFFKSRLNPKGVLPPIIGIPNTKLKINLLRIIRMWLQSSLTQKLIYKKYYIPSPLKLKIKSRYLSSNRKISEKYCLNLPSVYFE